jgi:hypothetical protein
VITAPTGYTISKNDTTFTQSVTLTETGGTVALTTIYVRFYPVAIQTYTGSITHISGTATERDISVDGSGYGAPPDQGTPKIFIKG